MRVTGRNAQHQNEKTRDVGQLQEQVRHPNEPGRIHPPMQAKRDRRTGHRDAQTHGELQEL